MKALGCNRRERDYATRTHMLMCEKKLEGNLTASVRRITGIVGLSTENHTKTNRNLKLTND